MKKISTLLCGLCALMASAAVPQGIMVPLHKPEAPAAAIKAPARRAAGDNAVLFGPSGGMMLAVNSVYNTKQCVALRFTDEDMKLFEGNYVSGIYYAHGPIMDEGVDEAFVFVSRSTVENDPFAGEGIVHEETMKFYEGKDYCYESLEFSEPVLIDPSKGNIYVGWGIDHLVGDHETDPNNNPTKVFGIDYLDHPDGYKSDFFGQINPETGVWEWWRYGRGLGEFCVWAYVTGDKLPVNEVELSSVTIPTTIYKPGKEIECGLLLKNFGANSVSSVGVDITIGIEEPVHQTVTLAKAMGYYGTAEATVKVTANTQGLNVPVTVKVTEINGDAVNNSADAEASSVVRVLPTGTLSYDRNVLIEEGTGTWCKYCPRGALGMEKMEEKYMADGRLMLVACHANDDMYVPQYYDILVKYMSSLPSAIINRTIQLNPEYTTLRSNYLSEIKRAAYATLGVEATYNPGTTTLTFDADVTLALDDLGSNYRLAFIVTNNGVGPYDQMNAYSGSSMEKWGQLEDEVEMLFDHVAASGTNAMGVDILPAELKAGETVHVTHTIDFGESPNITGGKLDNCRFIAALVNAHNGQIENVAQTLKATNYDYDSISEISVAGERSDVIYDLQGRRVLTPTHGLYIQSGRKLLK